MADWLRERGVGTVALKLGADGCYVSSEEFEGYLAAPAVKAIDGTGAGDAFAAGMLYGCARGLAGRAGRPPSRTPPAPSRRRRWERWKECAASTETLTLAGLESAA